MAPRLWCPARKGSEDFLKKIPLCPFRLILLFRDQGSTRIVSEHTKTASTSLKRDVLWGKLVSITRRTPDSKLHRYLLRIKILCHQNVGHLIAQLLVQV